MSEICLRPGIDGYVLATELEGKSACCPDTLCHINPCDLLCQFLNVLPSGPMWDEARREGVIQITQEFTSRQTCADNTCYPRVCVTMVDHAIYSARKLWSYILMFLGPVLQESSPFTAIASLDFWLDSLGWDDCLACEGEPMLATMLSGAKTVPMTAPAGACELPRVVNSDSVPAVPSELATAVKRGVAIALARMILRPIATVDAINFVIEELGCELVPESSSDPWASLSTTSRPTPAHAGDGDQVDTGCVVEDCTVIRPLLKYSLRLSSRTLRKVKGVCDPLGGCPKATKVTPCTRCETCEHIDAFIDCDSTGLCEGGDASMRLWPGMLAALCIIRRMIPAQANVQITPITC